MDSTTKQIEVFNWHTKKTEIDSIPKSSSTLMVSQVVLEQQSVVDYFLNLPTNTSSDSEALDNVSPTIKESNTTTLSTDNLTLRSKLRSVNTMPITEIEKDKKYLVNLVHTKRSLTYESHSKWDYVKLQTDTHPGTPVVFEESKDHPGQYYIRMTKCNYDGYSYFTRDSKGYIYLDQKKEASRFYCHFDVWGDFTVNHQSGKTTDLFFKLYSQGGNLWLSITGSIYHLEDNSGGRNRDLFELELVND